MVAALALSGVGCAPDFVARPRPVPPNAALRGDPDPLTAGAAPLLALERTASDPGPAAREVRREATARLVERFGPALLANRGRGVVTVPGPDQRPYQVRLRRGGGPGGVEPGRFVSLQPADRFAVSGVEPLGGNPGEGAPLVGSLGPVRPVHADRTVPSQPVAGLSWAVTAVAVLGPAQKVALELYDPQTVGRDARGRVLAADYSTPLAVSAGRQRRHRRGLAGFLRGGNYFPSAGLYPTERPTPDKAPLILVHGLLSDPGDFRHLRNALAADPEIRRRYQVWVFYYPTSLPVPYSAMLLREDLAALRRQLDPAGTHPALRRAVLIAHSMGGLLARLVVTDGGPAYYGHFFRRSPLELRLTAGQRDLLRRAFFYRADADVAKVIFIATPHRGSRLAGGLPGNLGRLLVRLPPVVLTPIRGILERNRSALADGVSLKPASSLDTLSPRDPTIVSLNETRPRPGVRLFSILGDRGRVGPVEASSDGVVPYASSHLEGTESERFVPAGHVGTLQRAETAAEVRRILRLDGAPPTPRR